MFLYSFFRPYNTPRTFYFSFNSKYSKVQHTNRMTSSLLLLLILWLNMEIIFISSSFTDLKPCCSDVMAVKIVITKEPNSAKFTDRVLTLSSDPVLVSRSSREQRSETSNAVFDCKVLCMKHFFSYFYSTEGSVQTSCHVQCLQWSNISERQWQQ